MMMNLILCDPHTFYFLLLKAYQKPTNIFYVC